MRESYPLPNQPRKKTPQPNETFTGTREQWELAIFLHAEYFTTFRLGAGPPGRRERIVKYVKTFSEALADAENDERALIYAVTKDGTSFCIPRKDYGMYKQQEITVEI